MTTEVTHIEIRRVQNGFIVQAVDYRRDFVRDVTAPVQRASFVAQDVDALKALIESILTMAEMQWLPTMDVPMLEMQRIINEAKPRPPSNEEMARSILKQYEAAQREASAQVAKKVAPMPNFPFHDKIT